MDTKIAITKTVSTTVLGRLTVVEIKRWSANTGPNTCYGDFGTH